MLCKVTIQDQIYEYESGTSFEEIARDLQDTCEHTIVLVFEDGRLRELHHHLKRDCEISFITTADKIGFETYRREQALRGCGEERDPAFFRFRRILLHDRRGRGAE